MVIDERLGSAELELIAERLAPPCQIGEYILEGLIRKTSTALIFVVRGGVFGSQEGVLKLTGECFAPLLQRELVLLNTCATADVHAVVRPVKSDLVWFQLEDRAEDTKQLAAIALPFLSGGDLVQWIGGQQPGAGPALYAGELVGSILRSLLRLPRPIVHGDVKPQNVLLPHPGAPVSELTLIDMDVSQELEVDIDHLDEAPREPVQRLVVDVNGFGELLYVLSTGREPPTEGEPDPKTDNAAFNGLVLKCMSSELDGAGYVCLADNGLWRDLERALAFERGRKPPNPLLQLLVSRASLAVVAGVLFVALLAAIASKFILT